MAAVTLGKDAYTPAAGHARMTMTAAPDTAPYLCMAPCAVHIRLYNETLPRQPVAHAQPLVGNGAR